MERKSMVFANMGVCVGKLGEKKYGSIESMGAKIWGDRK